MNESPPSLRTVPVSTTGWGTAGSSVVRPSRTASGSKLAALDQGRGDDHEEDGVEDVTRSPSTPAITGQRREPDRHRAAKAGPAQHQPLAHLEGRERGREHGGERPGDEDQDRREGERLGRDVAELASGTPAARAGRTARSGRSTPSPGGTRSSTRVRDRAGAEDQGRDVDGEEARAVRDARRARTQVPPWPARPPGRGRARAGRGCRKAARDARNPTISPTTSPTASLTAKLGAMSARRSPASRSTSINPSTRITATGRSGRTRPRASAPVGGAGAIRAAPRRSPRSRSRRSPRR